MQFVIKYYKEVKQPFTFCISNNIWSPAQRTSLKIDLEIKPCYWEEKNRTVKSSFLSGHSGDFFSSGYVDTFIIEVYTYPHVWFLYQYILLSIQQNSLAVSWMPDLCIGFWISQNRHDPLALLELTDVKESSKCI